jgi:outer membrane protein assembly factor BamB
MKIAPFLALSFLAIATAGAADWPQFRGPESTGLARGGAIPAQPKINWSQTLPGRGLSTPIVVGNRLFVTCASGPNHERLHVLCFQASDGAKLWERELRATGRTMTHPKTSVAASTPCSDGKHVFALWSSNDLAAFDLDGNLLWLRGLTADYPNVSNSLGMASSPIVVGETLVAVVENDSESYTVGIDTRTGRNIWKLERPKAANWASPIPWRADPNSPWTVVLQSSKGLTAVDPATGSQLWEYAEGASTMSSGVVANGVIFTPSHGITALAPKANGGEPDQVWRAGQVNPSTISPIVLNGHIISLNSAGVISTVEAASGKTGWKLRATGPFSSSPVGAANHLLLVNEKGLVQVIDAAAAEPSVVGKLELPLKPETKELILCTPAISGAQVFLRTDSTLWCLGT